MKTNLLIGLFVISLTAGGYVEAEAKLICTPTNNRTYAEMVFNLNDCFRKITEETSYSKAVEYALEIHSFVPNIYSWNELDFSEDMLNEEIRKAHLRELEAQYKKIDTVHDYTDASAIFYDIVGDILATHTSLSELPFTLADLAKSVHLAHVRELEYYYTIMQSPEDGYLFTIEYSEIIRKAVDQGNVSWSELSFSENDLMRLLNAAVMFRSTLLIAL